MYKCLYCRLHDRKISALGLCALVSMVTNRPEEVSQVGTQIIPGLLVLFQGLKRAYASMYIRSSKTNCILFCTPMNVKSESTFFRNFSSDWWLLKEIAKTTMSRCTVFLPLYVWMWTGKSCLDVGGGGEFTNVYPETFALEIDSECKTEVECWRQKKSWYNVVFML